MCILGANRRRDLAADACSDARTVAPSGPDFQRPSAPASSGYVQGRDPVATATASGVSQQLSTSASVPADWWRLFDCTVLNDAIRDGLANSPSTAAAQSQLCSKPGMNCEAARVYFILRLGAAAGASRAASVRQCHAASDLQRVPSTFSPFLPVSAMCWIFLAANDARSKR